MRAHSISRNVIYRPTLTAARIAIAIGILVFIASYLFLAVKLGLILGIAVGWLFSGSLAWYATLIVLYFSKRYMLRRQNIAPALKN
jgi:predicted RND superfamily exporter protein